MKQETKKELEEKYSKFSINHTNFDINTLILVEILEELREIKKQK